MACSLLSSYTLKSLCFRSRTYAPFLSVTTVSTKTKRDSFLITTLLCGGSVEFCCGDCGASLGASTVAGAGTGAGGLSCFALSQRGESSSAIGSEIIIQLGRLEVFNVFTAIAPDCQNQFGMTPAPLRAAICAPSPSRTTNRTI